MIMFKPINIPRGIANLFLIGDSNLTIITENVGYRPDLILENIANNPIKQEFINNYMSNVSPISCTKGTYYFVTDNKFNTYFGGL